jgi:predicted patatin/cPLA2 family phospholipase
MSIDFNEFPGKFTKLVLSGGGPRGLALLGALNYVYECNGLDDIDEYWGTSVGSVINLLLLIGYTPFEAFHQFFMLEHFADPETLSIQSILEESAFCPIEIFGNKVRHFIEKKLGPGADPTFHDLYNQFRKKIHIIGANVDTMRGECFNVDTHPFMSVIEAVEISCDLPYIFTRKKYNGYTYVDGGFINNYPVNLADNGIDYCLGICVFGDMTSSGNDHIGWIYRLLYMPIMELYRERTSRLSDRFTNIELNIDGINIIEMSPNSKKKIDIYSAGYQQARLQLVTINSQHPKPSSRLEHTCDDNELNKDWDDDYQWIPKNVEQDLQKEWDHVDWEEICPTNDGNNNDWVEF